MYGHIDGVPRSTGNWWCEVIKEGGQWEQVGGTRWTSEAMTGAEYIAKTLAECGYTGAHWARAFCIPHDLGSHYDLHYPAGTDAGTIGRPAPGALGPHLWVPAPEAFYLGGVRRQSNATRKTPKS